MQIITHTCPSCGTIISANELEESRVMKCPCIECDEIVRFEDLPDEEREFFVSNREQYRI